MKDYYRIRKKLGFTLVEIMIVVGIIALLATITIPNLLRTRLHANETSAIADLKTIVSAEITYRSANLGYATLTGLSSMIPSYLDRVLGCQTPPCTKNGYRFNANDITGGTFHAFAYPVTTGISGVRSFCATEDGIVRVDPAGSIPASHDACLDAPFRLIE